MRFLDPYNTEPNDLEPGDKLCYIAVAIVGTMGDWTAYYDLPNRTPEEVAVAAPKMDRQTAERLFPICVNAGLKWRD